MSISDNIRHITSSLPGHVAVVAVSKTHPAASVLEAYHAGQVKFGENKVQELMAKAPVLPSDIEWHFIGHLQTNKVRLIAPFISMIQSIDSIKLLKEVNKEAGKCQRTIHCLLEIHIAEEQSKFGLSPEEASALLASPEFRNLSMVRIRGVMGMATFTDDEEIVSKEFRSLKALFERLKREFFPSDPSFDTISMGMSGDYKLAVEEGSNLVRIGSAIFGERHYSDL
jgi:pyridoxal phosphate enzyme (YggS family)